MFLGFDIGNTNTLMGIYENDSILPDKIFRYVTDKKSDTFKLQETINDFLKIYKSEGNEFGKISGIAFSSVVPELNQMYVKSLEDKFNTLPHNISHKSNLHIKIIYDNPETLGVDRIVNADAAFTEYGESIIIDIGTAATFCVILSTGVFQGGMIAPGIGTTIKSLSEYASNLPEIKFEKPDKLIATDTTNAIKSGFFYGWISMVEGIIDRINSEYNTKFNIILTGGLSEIISENLKYKNIYDPLLTMKGIKSIYDLNC